MKTRLEAILMKRKELFFLFPEILKPCCPTCGYAVSECSIQAEGAEKTYVCQNPEITHGSVLSQLFPIPVISAFADILPDITLEQSIWVLLRIADSLGWCPVDIEWQDQETDPEKVYVALIDYDDIESDQVLSVEAFGPTRVKALLNVIEAFLGIEWVEDEVSPSLPVIPY